MNLSRIDIAESIEAYYEGTQPTAQDVSERLTYLVDMLNKAYDTMEDIDTEVTYAIGDTLNLLNLIKTKLQ